MALAGPDRAPSLAVALAAQLYTLIVTGRLQLDGQGASSAALSQTASLIGGVLAGQLQKALAGRLPLDVLTIQTGDTLYGTRLEAGTYLGSDRGSVLDEAILNASAPHRGPSPGSQGHRQALRLVLGDEGGTHATRGELEAGT